jgi:uncharacterized protein
LYRIVPDTNIIMAQLLNRHSGSSRIMHMWREGECELGMSRQLLAEVRCIIGKPYMQRQCNVPAEDIEQLLHQLRYNSVYVDVIPHVDVVKDDPSDNVLLATAAATNSDFVISNDRHLLMVWGYENVEVLRPAEFIRRASGGG